MRKKSQDELGTLVTREMKVMLKDESLTKEQRFDILTAVMFDVPIKNTLLASFAKSLKAGFEQINASRYRAIEREREWRKNHERKLRTAGYLKENGSTSNSMSLHDAPCNSMSLHDGLKQNKTKQGISPYKPPKGGEREPGKVRPEDLLEVKGRRDGKPVKAGESVSDADFRDASKYIAEAIEHTEAFARMRVNRRNLMRHLIPLVKKNCAAEDANKVDYKKAEAFGRRILAGIAAWTEAWKADDWQYAPGKITKWLADEKYLQPPRKKAAAPEEGRGCGECGAEIV